MAWYNSLLLCCRRGAETPLSPEESAEIARALQDADWLALARILTFHWLHYDTYTPDSRMLLDTAASMLHVGVSRPELRR